MKKILVIGGTGNIGHAVAEELVKKGYEVTALGYQNQFLQLSKDIKVVICDRNDEEKLGAIAQAGRYDIVYDLAAFSEEQVDMDYRLFPNCEQILITSSAAVYGITSIQNIPVCEDAPLIPARMYGVNKLKVEKRAMEYYYRFGWPVTLIRPSSCYGSQNAIFREIGVESSWIDRIQKGKPFASGNPQIVRNLLHVTDAARGFALMIEHQDRTIGQAYNLVGSTTLSWEQWHNAVMDVLGKYVEAVEIPVETLEAYGCPTLEQYKMSWQYHGFYSGEKLRRHIPEFTETVSLKDGIAGQLEFLFRNNLIPDSDAISWEDEAIRAQLNTRIMKGA